jgi:8-oxo-dGTP pyrophosphatase MutT (NUDIX family)
MDKLIFSNRPNPVAYLSRHVAVMVVPVFYFETEAFVPLGQRSNKVSDAGKFCLPCGYLDYDESGSEAAVREAYEELGLDLRGLLPDQPWFVQSDPEKDARQNVTLRFGCVVTCDRLPELMIDGHEVVAAEWRNALSAIVANDLAFNHAAIIKQFLKLRKVL